MRSSGTSPTDTTSRSRAPAQDLYLWDGVATAEAAKPTAAETRHGLLGAALLAGLPDAELDLLVRSGRQARFAAGEALLDTRHPTGDFVVLTEGRAVIAIVDGDGDGDGDTVVTEITAGETVGLLDAAPGGHPVVVRAATDCETVLLDGPVVGEVGSRNRDVAVAFNRIAAMRARRVERVAVRRDAARALPPEPTT